MIHDDSKHPHLQLSLRMLFVVATAATMLIGLMVSLIWWLIWLWALMDLGLDQP